MTTGTAQRSGRSGLGTWFVPTGRMRRRDWWLGYVLVIAVLVIALAGGPPPP